MPTILCVDDEPSALEFLQRTLKDFSLLFASDGEEALQILRTQTVDIVLTDHRMPRITGVELLYICFQEFPNIKRLLITAYGDLPDIVQARADKIVHGVIPKPARPASIQRAIDAALGLSLNTEKSSPDIPLSIEDSATLMEQTLRLLARQNRVVIRHPPIGDQEPRLEIVLEENSDLDRLRQSIHQLWGEPWVGPQQNLSSVHKKHPVVLALSGIWRKQELWVHEHEQDSYYLAIFPWNKEKKVTAVLGWLGPASKPLRNHELGRLHALALMEMSGFVLPDVITSEFKRPEGLVSFDYDWVITKNYVGPDRRQKPTPFLGRFIFWGRRRHVQRSLAERTIQFVDRISLLGRRLMLTYLVLSLIDTILTYVFVAKGPLSELNPVMRLILSISPTFFAVAKNTLSLMAIGLVVRFELVKIGWVALWVNVLMYALLDIYWVWILSTLMF